MFAQEERPKIKVEMGSILDGEMGKELGRRWSCLEGVEKDRFLQMALVDMARYKKEMKAYKSSQVFLLKKAALKKKSGGQKLTGELDKYFEFLSSHWRNISSAHPGLSAVHVQALVWQKWSKEVQGVVGNMGKGTVGNRLHLGRGWWGTNSTWKRGRICSACRTGCQRKGWWIALGW